MAYSDREFKESNINYLNKDFDSFKANLIEYAKTYFPNSYKDFNETSPGMMLIEMSAYVGDVLSFYIDQQYKEMMLPLSQDRRNLINIATMLGYKVKPTIPAYVDLTIRQQVDATADINDKKPDYSTAVVLDSGLQVESTADGDVIFETLEPIDFTVSTSLDINHPPVESDFDTDGIVSAYTLTRKVRAISGETKTRDFTIGSPKQYLKLTLNETNVIEILKVEDLNNGNRWYEVDYLAQDKVPIETHYTNNRATAYHDINDNRLSMAVPYTLQYKKTGKRFITEVSDDNQTSIVFGNGVLRRGDSSTLSDNIVDVGDAYVVTPGDPSATNLDIALDPRQGDSRMTLGETPGNTTLRITYRVGGGIRSNVAAGSLTNVLNASDKYMSNATTTITAFNDKPAFGGNDAETVEEIRHKTKQFFATQNRCVTKEDYEARVLSMPPRLGSIAKVFAARAGVDPGTEINAMINNLNFDNSTGFTQGDVDALQGLVDATQPPTQEMVNGFQTFLDTYQSVLAETGGSALGTIDLFVLGYDETKGLVYLPQGTTGTTTHPLKQNIKEYLNNFRLVTDQINIRDGKIINFGVAFEVVAHRSANKGDVKLRCIEKITDYFSIDKMQFRQPIYTSDLEYELMGLDGVRSVNFVRLTQDFASLNLLEGLPTNLDVLWDFNATNPESPQNTGLYNWEYNFADFYNPNAGANFVSMGVVLPSIEPAVFELKNPKENIRGSVK